MKILENVLLKELTTMRLGGAAEYVIEVEKKEELAEAFEFIRDKNLAVYFLGEGANSLGRDEGFSGAILMNKIKGIRILEESEEGGEKYMKIEVAGGEIWDDVVKFTTGRGLTGIEAMAKIPGTAGAAPVQNIGAYGQEIAQTLETVEAYDTLIDEIVEIPKEKMNFGYRKSIFNSGETRGRYFIISITLKLKRGEIRQPFYNSLQKYLDENGISDYSPKSIYQAVAAIRAEKLPDPKEIASAGSFFKNIYVDDAEAERLEKLGVPIRRGEAGRNKVNTGYLIEAAGLVGKSFFGFKVNEKASLVLINESGKSFSDLEKAVAEIARVVKEKFGVSLEKEPVEIKEN
ncbi:UDP-N-acetylmuramate dehydrogenase [Candidatus Saccharibacteria bacterium]|nr:UDP-N-acetylmuramate dehydrogenase [Candidatus Saccharibacteria bacterium]